MADDKDDKSGGISIHSDLSLDENASAPKTGIADGPIAVELPPWKIVLVSDLTPGKKASGLHEVDKNRFADLMSTWSPSVSLTVDCHLETGEKQMDVGLAFSSIKDFHPDAVARQVPALQTVCRVRDLVQKQGAAALSELPTLYEKLPIPRPLNAMAMDDASEEKKQPVKTASIPTETQATKKEALDAIFDVLGGESQTNSPPASNAMEALIGAVGDNAKSAPKKAGTGRILETIDRLLSRQIDAICHHPSFLQLEAAWRELKLLVDRIDFRENIRLEILCASKDDLRDLLVESVFRPAWQNEKPAPDILTITHPLGHTPVDTDLLGDLARLGESTQTPVFAFAGPSFFDQEHFTTLRSIPSIAEFLSGPGFEKWRALRTKDESAHLCLCTNAFLLRDPFHPKGWRTKMFDYTEGDDGTFLPWGSASVAMCAIMAETFTGHRASRAELADLPILGAGGLPGREEAATCAGFFSRSRLTDMADFGLCPLGCHASETGLYAKDLPMAKTNGPSIPAAVMAGHLSRIAIAAAEKHAGEKDEGKITSAVTAAITHLFYPGKEEAPVQVVHVETGPHPEEEGRRICVVDVNAPYKILGQPVSAQFAFEL